MMKKIRINAAILLLSISFIASVNAQISDPSPVLFEPYPFEASYRGAFEASRYLGKVGLFSRLYTHSSQVASPTVIFGGAFPFSTQGSEKGTGWSWGAVTGLQKYVVNSGNLHVSGAQFWELIFGRTIFPSLSEKDTGLRGYFEFAARNQRPRYDDRFGEFLQNKGIDIENIDTSLIFRTGASMDSLGYGLVNQRVPFFSPAIDLALHVPVLSQHSVLMLAQLGLPIRCFGVHVVCNPFFRLNYTRTQLHGAGFEFVTSKYMFGSEFVLEIKKRYLLDLQIFWTSYVARTQKVFLAAPYLRTSITIGF